MTSTPFATRPTPTNASVLRSRGYQYEMFDRSMKGNVIVAMDTGSGKTHIALLRIMAEVDRCRPGKLIWFLAPTVALCIQQQDSINKHLPSLRTRLLVGSDNVDRWSEQRIWDAALHNMQVIVSTHAVLADALTHGFVKMANLALLIFDEAHHCARGHPANKIMQNFYHPRKLDYGPNSVPHILGLSASPILRSKISELEKIEANLDSLSITPHVHRQEMFKYVHRPTLHRLEYEPLSFDENMVSSSALSYLLEICRNCHIQLGTHTLNTTNQTQQIRPPRTRLGNHLFKFGNKAIHIYEELGPWAADYFILESIAVLESRHDLGTGMFVGGRNGERASLLRILNQGPLARLKENRSLPDNFPISSKVERLISFLRNQDHEQCSGLLFVRQRATVGVLCHLLSIHPQINGRFECATFVGMSNNAAKKYTMAELLDLKAQSETLAEFRARRKNLIIATDVLEEGIDVTACNLVICFDPPPNLKSFIQRRGRARQEMSNFAIMFPQNEGASKLKSWRDLEQKLIEAYQNELRQIQDLEAIEDDVEVVPGRLEVRSTGAALTPDSAVAHVHHFCARLPRERYVDLRPTFTFTELPLTELITATVTLPNCLNLSLRSIAGIGLWRTERAAAQDAAFQAYVALHKAGLLNENLLPLSHTWALEDEDQPEDLSATVEVPAQHSPWGKLAEAWPSPDIHQTRITLKKRGLNTEDTLDMVLTTPSLIPSVPSFPLYWDESTTFILDFDTPQKVSLNNSSTLHTLRSITHTLSRSTRSGYTNDDRIDFIALFSPLLDESQLAAWFETNRGRVSAVEQFKSKSKPLGFIRTPSLRGSPHIFHRWNICNAEHGGEIEVQCIPLPRRRHFLVRNTLSKKTGPNSHQTISPKLHGFPIEDCTVDRLPFPYAQFNLFIPAILQHLEALMNADKLRKTILKDVLIKDTYHIITAISAPSAGWITDYQRYEFFGDTVLKFIVSLQLFCDNGNWHEGYLSEQKNRIVSNQRLAKAALEKGLDRYIMTHAFKSRKWAPMLVSDVQAEASGKRDISMKVLADVVEALIGAAYVDGGLDVARTCIHAFLPNIRVEAPQPNKPSITSHLDPSSSAVLKAEAIIGYHFRNKTILFEALTHPSCDRDIQIESYQRLEFLGDAVLDMLIVHFLAAHRHQTPLTQGQMSLIKVALVNAHFLGFLCLDFSCNEDTLDILQQPGGNFGTRAKTSKMHLWQIMRHSNSDILEAQNRCFARYAVLHSDITATLREGKTYPWLQLTQLNLDKFLSDMIESLVGAIFVDSEGSFTACESFLERIGLMPYLRRLVSGKVDISHVQMALELLTSVESVQYDVQAEAKPSSVERDGVQLV